MKTEEAWDQVEHDKYNKVTTLCMDKTILNIVRNLVNYGDDFALEKTKNYCFIYLEHWKIMIHKYDDKSEVLVIPDNNYSLTVNDMIYFEKILRE